jgi:hypothetical protein
LTICLIALDYRYKRRVSEYAARNKMSFPAAEDEFYPPYASNRNYPMESVYDGFKSQDDGGIWSGIEDNNDADDGYWYNTYTKPHYELKRGRNYDNIFNVKRYNGRLQNADNYYY